MRLRSPIAITKVVPLCSRAPSPLYVNSELDDTIDLLHSKLVDGGALSDKRSSTLPNLRLPEGFGTLATGSIFRSYVSASNDDENESITNVRIAGEIIVRDARESLDGSPIESEVLQPGSAIFGILSYRPMVVGDHTLDVHVSYSQQGKPRSYKKTYRFSVQAFISTSFSVRRLEPQYNQGEGEHQIQGPEVMTAVVAEIQVENIGSEHITINSTTLEHPSTQWTSIKTFTGESQSLFLSPKSCVQFNIVATLNSQLQQPLSLGYMRIEYTDLINEQGTIMTNPIIAL